MLAEYKTRTNVGVGLGIILQIGGRQMIDSGSPLPGLLIELAAFVLFIWGCVQYARGKGQSPWFGALGLLSILGLIVLVFLPDRYKKGAATQ